MLFRSEQYLADHLVFVSQHVLHDACRSYDERVAKKSSSIWAPVNEGAFIQNSGPRRKRFTYAFVGRFYWSKGVTFLLNAFSRLAKVSEDVVLRFYGSGPLEGAIRRRVKELGLSSSVEVRGWIEHKTMLSELSSDVDVVVHPSLYEACPIAVLEAMSLGKPVIVSDLPWSHEFVKDGVTGIRSRLDESSIFSQMKRLREDEELRSRLGTNARAFARANFHPEIIARAYLSLFDKVSGH
jgi:glycosyltransferase involved in cell wall biosynthesis